MADLSDVEDALVARLAAAFYPNGTRTRSATGFDVFVEAGWPLPAKLEQTLGLKPDAAGARGVRVSVYPTPGMSRPVSNAMISWSETRDGPPTIIATTAPDQVTFAGHGSSTVAQNVAVVVHGEAYVLAVEPAATATSLATGFAALISTDHPGTASAGTVLTIPGAEDVEVRVGVSGHLRGEVEREQQAFGIYVWAGSHEHRRAAGKIARAAMADSPRMALPDGSVANLTYRSTGDNDRFEKPGIYRRDLHYWIEFGTFLDTPAYEVVAVPITTVPMGDQP